MKKAERERSAFGSDFTFGLAHRGGGLLGSGRACGFHGGVFWLAGGSQGAHGSFAVDSVQDFGFPCCGELRILSATTFRDRHESKSVLLFLADAYLLRSDAIVAIQLAEHAPFAVCDIE